MWVFLLYKNLLFILLHVIVDKLCKILSFKIWFFILFSDLILIKNQLILIYYNKDRIKRRETEIKKT
jgi:hypothetical protein